jgi:hypothetical protein
LPASASVQLVARLAVWFVGGIALALGMALTGIALTGLQGVPWSWWWVAGLAFIAIEVVAHLVLQLTGRPSLFDGRG